MKVISKSLTKTQKEEIKTKVHTYTPQQVVHRLNLLVQQHDEAFSKCDWDKIEICSLTIEEVKFQFKRKCDKMESPLWISEDNRIYSLKQEKLTKARGG